MKRGDVIEMGPHRLMCGDAGDPADVARLFGDRKPDLVFTSPPYAQQRQYAHALGNWDATMRAVFGAMPHHAHTQILVNLGLVHCKGEWWPYWDDWIEWMRAQGWRRFGWYVWDKKDGIPGVFNGRPAPCFEFIFHFNHIAPKINKTTPCKNANKSRGVSRACRRTGHGGPRSWHGDTAITQPYKIPDSVFRVASRGARGVDHPAVFPVQLAQEIIRAYTAMGGIVFDPFMGSGSSILAAEQEGRICYGMEIAPEYCDMALDRWAKRPRQTLRLPMREAGGGA